MRVTRTHLDGVLVCILVDKLWERCFLSNLNIVRKRAEKDIQMSDFPKRNVTLVELTDIYIYIYIN
jgi:hypothetical protein